MTTRPAEFNSYFQAIINDIWIVDESYAAIFFISEHYEKFQSASFLELFGRLQASYFIDSMILSLGRLFDERSDVLSIPNLIKNCSQFGLTNKSGLITELKGLGGHAELIQTLEQHGLSREAAKKLQKLAPTKQKLPELKRIIDRRHSAVAHRANNTKKFEQPFFTDIKTCSDIAKRWIICFALGVENRNLRDARGDYRFSSEAKKISRQMKNLLRHLYLLPAINKHQTDMIESFLRRNRSRLGTSDD